MLLYVCLHVRIYVVWTTFQPLGQRANILCKYFKMDPCIYERPDGCNCNVGLSGECLSLNNWSSAMWVHFGHDAIFNAELGLFVRLFVQFIFILMWRICGVCVFTFFYRLPKKKSNKISQQSFKTTHLTQCALCFARNASDHQMTSDEHVKTGNNAEWHQVVNQEATHHDNLGIFGPVIGKRIAEIERCVAVDAKILKVSNYLTVSVMLQPDQKNIKNNMYLDVRSV